MTGSQADAILRTGVLGDRQAVLRHLPPDTDPELAAGVLVTFLNDHPFFPAIALSYPGLPETVLRAFLARLEAIQSAPSIFLRTYLSDAEEITPVWERALRRLADLDRGGVRVGGQWWWGSPEQRAILEGLARDPRALRALQAAAVGCEDIRIDGLAVLAIDGSEASIDALLPHFERAVRLRDGGLHRLMMLKEFTAPTGAFVAMIARVQSLIEDLEGATSPGRIPASGCKTRP